MKRFRDMIRDWLGVDSFSKTVIGELGSLRLDLQDLTDAHRALVQKVDALDRTRRVISDTLGDYDVSLHDLRDDLARVSHSLEVLQAGVDDLDPRVLDLEHDLPVIARSTVDKVEFDLLSDRFTTLYKTLGAYASTISEALSDL